VLEAFFYGKAFAEAVNDRLGTAVDAIIAQIGKINAELLRCILRNDQQIILCAARP
jgi:hypothetical protein